jgi:hypothetical protein
VRLTFAFRTTLAHGHGAFGRSPPLHAQIARRINGGTNGSEDRMPLWESGKGALGVTA